MKKICLFILTIILAGCGTIREIPVQQVEKVVYRDSTIYVKDTLTIEIPVQKIVTVQPQDTTSVLSTSLAHSEAKIEKGMLYHSLEQKGSVKYIYDTIYVTKNVDRVIEKEVPIKVEVEKKITPTWSWYCLIYSIVLTLLVAFVIYLRFRGR